MQQRLLAGARGGGAAIVRCRSFFFWCLEAQGVGILVCGVSDRVNASAGA